MIDFKDGKWHFTYVSSAYRQAKVFRNTVQKRGFVGRIARIVDGKREEASCSPFRDGHIHAKRSGAEACGKATAKRHNEEGT